MRKLVIALLLSLFVVAPVAAQAPAFIQPSAPPTPAVICGAVGDSITNPDYNNADNTAAPPTTTNLLTGSNGYMAWANVLSGQRVVLPASLVLSYPGKETSQVNAGMGFGTVPGALGVIAKRPSCMIYEAGTNNILHDPTGATVGSFASIVGDIRAMLQAANAAGVRVILAPILPRDPSVSGGTAWTAAQYDVMDRVNAWEMRYAANNPGTVAYAGYNADLTDPASVGAKPRTNYTLDGTHPTVLGAYYMGKAIAAILRQWYPPVDILPTSNTTYTASNPSANLLSNGMFQGTAGTATSPSTGTVATNWTATSLGGLTCTHSIVTSAITGQTMEQIVMSGTYTVSGSSSGPTYGFGCRLFNYPVSASLGTVLANLTYEASCYVEWDAGNGALPSLQWRWGNSSGFNTALQQQPRELPAEAWAGVLRTFPHTFVSTTNAASGDYMVNFYVYAKSYPDGSYTANQTVRVGRCTVRPIDGVTQ